MWNHHLEKNVSVAAHAFLVGGWVEPTHEWKICGAVKLDHFLPGFRGRKKQMLELPPPSFTHKRLAKHKVYHDFGLIKVSLWGEHFEGLIWILHDFTILEAWDKETTEKHCFFPTNCWHLLEATLQTRKIINHNKLFLPPTMTPFNNTQKNISNRDQFSKTVDVFVSPLAQKTSHWKKKLLLSIILVGSWGSL